MGRIKGRRPEETRDSVLRAATSAFAEHGFADATLGVIAARAGVTAATLPYHFGDKRGLYSAVIERIHRDILSSAALVEPDDDLATVMAKIIDWTHSRRDGIRLALREVLVQRDDVGTPSRLVHGVSYIAGRVAQRFDTSDARALDVVTTLMHLATLYTVYPVGTHEQLFGQDTAGARERMIATMVAVAERLLGTAVDAS